MNEALDMGEILSKRIDFTTTTPLRIHLGKGEHNLKYSEPRNPIQGTVSITTDNVIVCGQGLDTVLLFGFAIRKKENVTVMNLTIRNYRGPGFSISHYNTHVNLIDCHAKDCQTNGLFMYDYAKATATRCVFSDNDTDGIKCTNNSKLLLNDCQVHTNKNDGVVSQSGTVVSIHGEASKIHGNQCAGIHAWYGGTVNLYLHLKHKTTQGNGEDRRMSGFSDLGYGVIANIPTTDGE